MNSSSLFKKMVIACLCCFSTALVQAVPISSYIVDSSEVRSQVKDLYFSAPLPVVRTMGPMTLSNSAGEVFQVRVEEKNSDTDATIPDNTVQIIVAPQKAEKVESYTGAGVVVSWMYTYPSEVPGSWVLFRDRESGKPVCIRYYFTGESSVYVQFRPAAGGASGKSLADLVIDGLYRAKNVVVGVPVERFYTASFADIQKATRYSIPWYTYPLYSEMYDGNRQMVAVIRDNLSRFRFVDGVVQDEFGNTAFVGVRESAVIIPEKSSSGDDARLYVSSCGFVKWIADGMVRPLSGSGLLIEPLLVSTVEHRPGGLAAAWGDDYNTSLSLNWTRNLASATFSVFNGNDYAYENAGVLVNSEPFTAVYSAATGYTTSCLNSLMYHLALKEPDHFYLGAIRHTVSADAEISVYNEAVAFFPWIDENQRFHCAVFMNGSEITLKEFMETYQGDHVQLVRINSTEQFFPR